MSGTDIAHGQDQDPLLAPQAVRAPMRCPVLTYRMRPSAYARAMPCPVLAYSVWCRLLRVARYGRGVWCRLRRQVLVLTQRVSHYQIRPCYRDGRHWA
eukprot:537508-Rhodomonas_salina.1